MKYTADELEFAISQYIDGMLGQLEQAALEEILASDKSARAMLAEYRRLNEALRTKLSQPQVDFELFSKNISDALGKAEAPVKHYRPSFTGYAKIISVAASIVIAISVITKLVMNRETPTGSTPITIANKTSSNVPPDVAGPSVATVSGVESSDISIGAPPGFASAGFADQAVITRTPQLVIESSALPVQDNMPY